MNTLSFPGLGIGEFTINKVAFSIFGLEVRWYGILITVGIILAFFYIHYRAKQEGFSSDDVFDYAIFTIVFAILGARLYYVLMNLESYNSFSEVLAIRNGGLAIYGGIIAGFITIVIVSRVKKKSFVKFIDAVSPGVMIGQIIGRWGNFFNVEAFGYETNLPWRMGISVTSGTMYVHPTFLYESLWNLAGFLLINAFYKKKKYDGQIFLMYITWYGFGRMLIEGLRTDSLYIGSLRVSQLVGLLTFAAGLITLIVLFITKKKGAEKNGEHN